MRPARVLNFILICAQSKIRIAEARVGFKAANRESFPYIMHIVDEPRKFSPSNVLTYTVPTVILLLYLPLCVCYTKYANFIEFLRKLCIYDEIYIKLQ